jgi:hypothetical protein
VLEFTQKKLTTVSIHLKKCVPIYWLILLGQGILCVHASRLAPPAWSAKRKSRVSFTYKNGNVRNLTNGHISRPGHPRAILTCPTSCQPARERERAKLVYLVVTFSLPLLHFCQSAQRCQAAKRTSSVGEREREQSQPSSFSSASGWTKVLEFTQKNSPEKPSVIIIHLQKMEMSEI